MKRKRSLVATRLAVSLAGVLAAALVSAAALGCGSPRAQRAAVAEPEPDHPCDPYSDEEPAPVPDTGPRCGDGVVADSPVACTRHCSGGCGVQARCSEPTCVAMPEACDGTELQGQTCESLGFVGGELSCSSDCRRVRISGCEVCPQRAGLRCRSSSAPDARGLRMYAGAASALLTWTVTRSTRPETFAAFVGDDLSMSTPVSLGESELVDGRASRTGYYLVLLSNQSHALRVIHLELGRTARTVYSRDSERDTLRGTLFDAPSQRQLLLVEEIGAQLPGSEPPYRYAAYLLSPSGKLLAFPEEPVAGTRAFDAGGRVRERLISFPIRPGRGAKKPRALARVQWMDGMPDHYLGLHEEGVTMPYAAPTAQPLGQPFEGTVGRAQFRLATREQGFEDTIEIGGKQYQPVGPAPRVARSQPTSPDTLGLKIPAADLIEAEAQTVPNGDHLIGFVRLTQHIEIPDSLVTSEAARDIRTAYPADEVVVVEAARSPAAQP